MARAKSLADGSPDAINKIVGKATSRAHFEKEEHALVFILWTTLPDAQ